TLAFSDYIANCFFWLTVIINFDHFSLHDALPIYHQTSALCRRFVTGAGRCPFDAWCSFNDFQINGLRQLKRQQTVDLEIVETARSEEHTSELQSRFDLVCRLLLEK